MIDEVKISNAIIEKGLKRMREITRVDVVIAGGGPSGLTAAYYLAKDNINVVLFERALKLGGGMPGGGNGYPFIVVQKTALDILKEFDVNFTPYDDEYFIADSLETTAKLTAKAIDAGAKILNLISCEDVVLIDDRVQGVVVISTPIEMAGLHVDPLTVRSRAVIDATGHASEVTRTLVKKGGVRLNTETGGVVGEKPMWADFAETTIIENTKEVYPGLFVCGMAANAVFGGPRMGPIFGGMLLSGKEVARIVKENL